MKYLDKSQEIREFIDSLTDFPRLWLDTETADARTSQPSLSILQVLADPEDINGKSVYILDLLEKPDLVDYFVQKIMANPEIEKVFHNASYDLPFLGGKEFALNVTCTYQLAQKLSTVALNSPNRKLKTLAERLCNFSLGDQEGDSNWSRRPLNRKQLRYATMDVVYLTHVHQQLLIKLNQVPSVDLYHTFKQLINSTKFELREYSELSLTRISLKSKHVSFPLYVSINPEKQQLYFISLSSAVIDSNYYYQVDSTLTNLNDNLVKGKFMVFDGHIVFKTSITNCWNPITKKAIHHALNYNAINLLKGVKLITQTLGNLAEVNLDSQQELNLVTNLMGVRKPITLEQIKASEKCPRLFYLHYHHGGPLEFYPDQIRDQFELIMGKLEQCFQSVTEQDRIEFFYQNYFFPQLVLPQLQETERDGLAILSLWQLVRDLIEIWNKIPDPVWVKPQSVVFRQLIQGELPLLIYQPDLNLLHLVQCNRELSVVELAVWAVWAQSSLNCPVNALRSVVLCSNKQATQVTYAYDELEQVVEQVCNQTLPQLHSWADWTSNYGNPIPGNRELCPQCPQQDRCLSVFGKD